MVVMSVRRQWYLYMYCRNASVTPNKQNGINKHVVCSDPGPLTPAFVSCGSRGKSSKTFLIH